MLSHKRALVSACDKQLADINAWQQQSRQELAKINHKQSLLEQEKLEVETKRTASLYYLKHPLLSFLEHHLSMQTMLLCKEYLTFDYCMKCDSWHPILFRCLKDVFELKPKFYFRHDFISMPVSQHNGLIFADDRDNEAWNHVVCEMLRMGKTIKITREYSFDWLATKVYMRMFGPRIYFGRECGPTFEFYDFHRNSSTNDPLHLFTATARSVKHKNR